MCRMDQTIFQETVGSHLKLFLTQHLFVLILIRITKNLSTMTNNALMMSAILKQVSKWYYMYLKCIYEPKYNNY